ncbi:MAG TPA: crossover junction endodeoxyribonuclease RuvC, partial [Rhizobiales bacterium]|nr:crossover junction endodeoxyribonuclease RuvC [Hyphomicrobiales bacterium]
MSIETIRIIGIDPGLRNTGWGIIAVQGSHLSYVADGTVRSNPHESLSGRLLHLYQGLSAVLSEWQPDEAAVEETFVN